MSKPRINAVDVLDGAPIAKPVALPLAHNAPEGPARELLNGRGFLRVMGGKDGTAAPNLAVPPLPVPSPAAPALPVIVAASGRRWEQLDLLAWHPKAEAQE